MSFQDWVGNMSTLLCHKCLFPDKYSCKCGVGMSRMANPLLKLVFPLHLPQIAGNVSSNEIVIYGVYLHGIFLLCLCTALMPRSCEVASIFQPTHSRALPRIEVAIPFRWDTAPLWQVEAFVLAMFFCFPTYNQKCAKWSECKCNSCLTQKLDLWDDRKFQQDKRKWVWTLNIFPCFHRHRWDCHMSKTKNIAQVSRDLNNLYAKVTFCVCWDGSRDSQKPTKKGL